MDSSSQTLTLPEGRTRRNQRSVLSVQFTLTVVSYWRFQSRDSLKRSWIMIIPLLCLVIMENGKSSETMDITIFLMENGDFTMDMINRNHQPNKGNKRSHCSTGKFGLIPSGSPTLIPHRLSVLMMSPI